jgi:2-dehydro-3-deoxyphosphooctonate aldolase (KDO 8-P synthase)
LKASFDKANRTSISSYRGPGLERGLQILKKVRESLEVPVLSDIHETYQASRAGEVLDVIQIPAFLCRQTDLLLAAASTGRIINVKKGQFISPWDVKNIVGKLESVPDVKLLLTERGSSFGYNNLVVDFKSLPVMRSFGYPVVFDATHSVQLPGGSGSESSGQAEFIPYLAKAAVAVGIDGLFFEVHETPEEALSDSANALPLNDVARLLEELKEIDSCSKAHFSE